MVRELFTKVYTRINWKNRSESMTTALGATLLNRMDYAIDETDSRIAALDVLKAEESEVLQMVKEWSIDEETGIITVTKKNGEKIMFDLNIEKIPVSFTLSQAGILTMTTDDGTKFTADIGSMIPVLTFKASDTISVTVEGTGINKTYSFSVKEGSIKDKHLQPSYLADIKVQAQAADKSAGAAQTEADRAKTEADRAKTEADRAKTAADNIGTFNITADDIGAVKKAGDTMTGTLASSKSAGTYLAGNQGQAIINSTAAAGAYTMLDKLNSTNGYFTDGVFQGRRELHYTAKSTVDAKTNAVTKNATLLDEAGNSNFPGIITAQGFSGNASSATKLATPRSINGLLFDGTGDVTNDGTYREIKEEYIVNGNNSIHANVMHIDCPHFKLVKGAKVSVTLPAIDKLHYTIRYINVNNTGSVALTKAENLYNKICTFLYDGNLWNKIHMHNTLSAYARIYGWGADEYFIQLTSGNKYLVIGRGCSYSESTANHGADDYFKDSILQKKDYSSTSDDLFIFQETVIGSAGSTARYSIVKEKDTYGVTIKIPTGSYADVSMYCLE